MWMLQAVARIGAAVGCLFAASMGLASAEVSREASLAAAPQGLEPKRYPVDYSGLSWDGPALAYHLVRDFMTEEQWQREVQVMRGKIADWQKDNQGDAGRYLNDRLIIVALGAAGGEVEKIRKGILWLAYYKAFDQSAPLVVGRFLQEHRGSMQRLLKSFSWEQASEYVKQKRWREDIEERRRLGEMAKKKAAGTDAKEAKDGKDKDRIVAAAQPVQPAPAQEPQRNLAQPAGETPNKLSISLPRALDWRELESVEAERIPLSTK